MWTFEAGLILGSIIGIANFIYLIHRRKKIMRELNAKRNLLDLYKQLCKE